MRSGLVVLLVLFGIVKVWAQPQSAIEYQSLMNVRFYEANGSFLVEELELVFPPPNVESASFVITKASGEKVVACRCAFKRWNFQRSVC